MVQVLSPALQPRTGESFPQPLKSYKQVKKISWFYYEEKPSSLTPTGYAFLQPQFAALQATVSHPLTAMLMDCVNPWMLEISYACKLMRQQLYSFHWMVGCRQTYLGRPLVSGIQVEFAHGAALTLCPAFSVLGENSTIP